jgi:hypothetical protein
MLDKIDNLCAERDELKAQAPGHNKGKSLEAGDGDEVVALPPKAASNGRCASRTAVSPRS